MKVTIKKKPLTKGRQRLVLDYYPPIYSSSTSGKTRYENLKLYIYKEPVSDFEFAHNAEAFELAEKVRAKRQLDKNIKTHGVQIDHIGQRSFSDYFRELAEHRQGLSWHNWNSSVRYFQVFAAENVTRQRLLS